MTPRGNIGSWRPRKTIRVRDFLSKAVKIHVCKDGTCTYRRSGEPVFNGRALPVYSVDTIKEAKDLQTMLCFRVPAQHPDMMPGQTWYKLMWVRNSPERSWAMDIPDLKIPVFREEHLDWIGSRMHEVWAMYVNPRRYVKQAKTS